MKNIFVPGQFYKQIFKTADNTLGLPACSGYNRGNTKLDVSLRIVLSAIRQLAFPFIPHLSLRENFCRANPTGMLSERLHKKAANRLQWLLQSSSQASFP